MFNLAGIPSQLKWCGAVALFAFTITARAQQLYSDSTVAAQIEKNLCMTLPDTFVVALNSDSTIALAENYSIISYSCGECFTYSQSHFNFSSFLIIPSVLFTTIPDATGIVTAFFPPEPRITEYALGSAATSPVRANFLMLSPIARAAEDASMMVTKHDMPFGEMRTEF